MSVDSKPLALFGGIRLVGWARFEIYETLYFTKDKLIVARTERSKAKEMANLIPEQLLLNGDKNNFALPYREVDRVELKKTFRTIQIRLHRGKEKYQWSIQFMQGNEFLMLDDVKRVLQPIFTWKLEAPDEI
ncbi:MAG: hypothetical protein ACM3UY_01515 [Methanocella sp.]